MSLITFDNTGDKKFEAGVDHCVLYPLTNGAYNHGVAWNGITGITESPEGGDAQDFYADNIKYGSLRGAENFGGTIECYTYPDEWKGCDGRADLADGVTFSQQSRKIFGLSYRTLIGSDTMELGAGYILHIIYGCTASPSSKSRSTVNESPEAGTMSYEFKTTPVNVSKIDNAKATSHIEIDSTKVSPKVLAAIEECNDLAPLHNPANLIGIAACRELMPETPMVAVFDTAFHQTMPEEAYLYGIPYEYYEKYKVRRYGFHGTSHSYVSHQAAKLLGKGYEDLKLIVCHLGNGASVSAVKKGKCVDTSMGLTPLEGLIMGTRSGDIDPAIVEFLCNKEQKSVGEILSELNKKSGVLGLSGGFSSDFRDLEDEFQKGSEFAVRTMNAFAYRVAKYIGAYTAAMNGVDAICFTAGLGENSGFIREKICAYLGYLGITLDAEANSKRGVDIDITTPDSRTRVLVIPTNEELAIARETYALVK